jgi:hypothetical protein
LTLGSSAPALLRRTRFSKDGFASVVLHRDIYWLGRQWAVTGYGIQAVDKKLDMKFDVEAGRIWEEGLAESMASESWLDVDDFNEALAVARRRARQHPASFQNVWAAEK